MPLDQSLVGHETTPQTDTLTVEQIRQFAAAVGDANPMDVFNHPYFYAGLEQAAA
jgi:acyl dehydratase